MKVLFLVGEVNYYLGINPFIYSQGESLKKAGIDVEYMVLRGFKFYKYIFGIYLLRKFLKNNKFDIIHSHYSYCGYTASFQSDIPVVLSFMGSDVLEKYGKIKTFIEKRVKNRVFKKLDCFICKSNNIKSCLPDNINSVVLPNGVNFEKFYPVEKTIARRQLGLSLEKKYILFASNPERKEKNFKLAEECIKELNDENIEMLIVFDKTQEELNLYYNASDVLLLTSYYEGSPNVVKEAIVCNIPVVSTDVGDIRKMTMLSKLVLIANSDKIDITEKLKSAMNAVINTSEKSNIESLNEKYIAREIINVYNIILGNKK